jgi:hypothetical protein
MIQRLRMIIAFMQRTYRAIPSFYEAPLLSISSGTVAWNILIEALAVEDIHAIQIADEFRYNHPFSAAATAALV